MQNLIYSMIKSYVHLQNGKVIQGCYSIEKTDSKFVVWWSLLKLHFDVLKYSSNYTRYCILKWIAQGNYYQLFYINTFKIVWLSHCTSILSIVFRYREKEALKRGRCMILEISNPSAFNVSKGSIIFDEFKQVSRLLIVLWNRILKDKATYKLEH